MKKDAVVNTLIVVKQSRMWQLLLFVYRIALRLLFVPITSGFANDMLSDNPFSQIKEKEVQIEAIISQLDSVDRRTEISSNSNQSVAQLDSNKTNSLPMYPSVRLKTHSHEHHGDEKEQQDHAILKQSNYLLSEKIDEIIGDYAKKYPRKIRILIDPGHGGKDPGAIGQLGTKEKTVVLEIAKQLRNELISRQRYIVKLTRNRDTFIKLGDRSLSNINFDSDLFLSIHADSWYDAKAQGASVYMLSRKGASSVLAKYLARNNNASLDHLGVKYHENGLRNVLADLALDGSIRHSKTFATMLIDELGKITKMQKKRVERANFAVLKSLAVPSVLIETGFISNQKEEKNLKSLSHQKKLAYAIADSVDVYFQRHPIVSL